MACIFGAEIYSTPLFGAMTLGYMIYYTFHVLVGGMVSPAHSLSE